MEEEEEKKLIFKILILGDSNVGKTSFITRYVEDNFSDTTFQTIGQETYNKELIRNNQNIILQIYDTCGQERFQSISKNYYKVADGIILLYDITNISSFDSIKNWIQSLNNNSDLSKIELIVVANKFDLFQKQNMVSEEMKENLEKNFQLEIIEASAKINKNVEESFNKLIDRMMKLKEIKSENIEKEEKIKLKIVNKTDKIKNDDSSSRCIIY